jgi:uncharacterized protein
MNIAQRILGRLLLATLLFPASCLQAQSAKPASSEKHSLWKIQGKQAAVYLLGSVHVLKKENYPLPAQIENAFSNAQTAVFEADIDQMENPELAMKLASKARLPEGQTLHDQLSPETYSALSNYLQKAGLPIQFLEPLAPAMAALTLVAVELKKMGLDSEYGLDKHFFTLARQSGKKIIALETVEFQIDLMTGFSKEEGELLVKTTLRDVDTLQNDLGDMLKAWQTGDTAKLEKLLNEAKADAPIIFKRLVTDRNRNWLPKIEELVNGKENAIVIVGAGHLVGKDSVVDLLKKKGHKISQE